jgi:adenosylmethionine-8-amino-7-oxononanoate aminotransferase
VERAAERGAYLQKRLQELRSHEIVGDVRGLGLVAGVELVRDRDTKESFDVSLGVARRVWMDALDQGVIVRPLPGDVLAMSPPFVISEAQIDRIVLALDKAIASAAKDLRIASVPPQKFAGNARGGAARRPWHPAGSSG